MTQLPDIHATVSLYESDMTLLNALAAGLSTVDRKVKFRRVLRFLAAVTGAKTMTANAHKFIRRKKDLPEEPVTRHADVMFLRASVETIFAVEKALLAQGIVSNTTEILRATWHNPPAPSALNKLYARFDAQHPDGRSKAGRALREGN